MLDYLNEQENVELDWLLEQEELDGAKGGLIAFAEYIDPVAAKWYRAAHLRQIAGVLERVERGELSRVIISVPPRHWKSSLSVKFCAWYLGRNSTKSIILASYALGLSEKFSREIREIVTSNRRYLSLFDVRVKKDSNRADDWSLTGALRSSVRAVGVGGGITGHGANVLIVDDPIADYEQAQSETQRNNLWEWYRQVLRTRLEPGGAIVLIQTRWHEDDLAGRLVRAEKEEGGEHWDTINLPAQSESGEYLWLDRYSAEEYAALRASVGDYAWRSLYQGQPAQVEGNLIKREWFEYVPQLPSGASWKVRAWDTAFTEKQTQKHDPDYTAGVCGVVWNDVLYLGLPRLFRKSIEDTATEIVVNKMSEVGVRYGVGKVAVRASIIKAMNTAGFSIEPFGKEENRDKVSRASGWINKAATGHVKLVGTEKEWEQFVGQWWSFPQGAHDDSVDAVSGVVEMLGFVFMSALKVAVKVQAYKFVEQM